MGRPDSNKSSNTGFATLEPRVNHVSEHTIRKKWKKLPSSSHNAASELILSARDQSRGRKGKVGLDTATEDCVQEVADKLIQKLSRIPYPQGTDESHFDHEANLHRIGRVEEQLTSNIHSMNLLRAQIAKEEALVKEEEAQLEQLERSLQSNQAFRRQQSRNMHPVARKIIQDHGEFDLLDLEDENKKELEPSVSDLFQDEELRPVLHQLQNHLNSMHNNIADVTKVTKVIKNTDYYLESFAASTLDTGKYRQAAGTTTPDQT